jgi:hypothetical protein
VKLYLWRRRLDWMDFGESGDFGGIVTGRLYDSIKILA